MKRFWKISKIFFYCQNPNDYNLIIYIIHKIDFLSKTLIKIIDFLLNLHKNPAYTSQNKKS